MATGESGGYNVVTYVDRTRNGRLRAWPVRRVCCHDEAGAILEAIKSLVIAATQPGLYWSEWAPADPAGHHDEPAGPGVPGAVGARVAVPDRALLRSNGEIVLDLVALRGGPGPAGVIRDGRLVLQHPARPAESVERVERAARCASRGAGLARAPGSPERGARVRRGSAGAGGGWSVPKLVREDMLLSGCGVGEIARELGARCGMRPRVAWRYALNWSQPELAQEFNWRYRGAGLTFRRVSERERWPSGGHRPSPEYLVRLAETYGHGCVPADLVDARDREHLGPVDWAAVTAAVNRADELYGPQAPPSAPTRSLGARRPRGT